MHKEVKTADEFDAEISSGKVLVDFWATWCGPCMIMGQRIADELEPMMPEIKVVKVNVDEAPELASRFGITSIPTLICFSNGNKIADFVGVTSVREISEAFNSLG